MKNGDMIDPKSRDNDMLNEDLFIHLDRIVESAEYIYMDSLGSRHKRCSPDANKLFMDMAGVSILFEEPYEAENSRIYEKFKHHYWYVWVIEDVDKFFLWKMSRWD